jgi:hypothetical protein
MKQRYKRTYLGYLQSLAGKFDRSYLAEYVSLMQRPFRLMFVNFLAGLARGFGIAVGLTIVASLFIVFLTYLANLNLPVIGNYIAQLVRIVNQQLRFYS